MRKNEAMIGNNPSAKVAIQSAYKEGDKFVANVVSRRIHRARGYCHTHRIN